MRKVATWLAVLGLAGVCLINRELLITMVDRLDLGAMQCSELTRAEPRCPLC